LFAELVIVYGSCANGQCPPNVQKSPVAALAIPAGEIYRTRPLASILRKARPVYAVPVLVLPVPTEEKKEGGK
jgi:hypothetical protein